MESNKNFLAFSGVIFIIALMGFLIGLRTAPKEIQEVHEKSSFDFHAMSDFYNVCSHKNGIMRVTDANEKEFRVSCYSQTSTTTRIDL